MFFKSLLALTLLAGTAQAAGQVCGTRGAKNCIKGEYCKFPIRAQCGATDQGGKCRSRPQICTMDYNPVCGCDGKTYGNACSAAGAGVSVKRKGAC